MKTPLFLLLFTGVIALRAEASPAGTAETIRRMRLRQEDEEKVVRVISQPVTLVRQEPCTPGEKARQRVRELGGPDGFTGTVNVEAGHGEVSIEGNSGTINNSVNIQVDSPDAPKCP